MAKKSQHFVFKRLLKGYLKGSRRQFSPTLEGLVLGCIDADFCKQISILQHFSRSTVAPIGGKKCAHFSSPRKKGTFGRSRGRPRAPWGLPKPNHRSTLGQPSVNPRSTLGIFPSHRGPIFADFAGFVD